MGKEGNASRAHDEAPKYVFDLCDEDDIVEDEEEEEEDDDGEEESEEDGEGDEDEDYEEDKVETSDALDSLDNGTYAEECYPDFVGKDYETLARKKRKPLGDSRPKNSIKKTRRNDGSRESLRREEVTEFMMMGHCRGVSRKTKKRPGRRKGSKNKCSPEISRLHSKARHCYAFGDYQEAIPILKVVIMQAPHLPDPYQTLGDVHSALGDKSRALSCYHVAAQLAPKNASLWTLLFTKFMELGNISGASYSLSRALSADPDAENVIALKLDRAALHIQLQDFEQAAALYEQIVQTCPADVKALKLGAETYAKCGRHEHYPYA